MGLQDAVSALLHVVRQHPDLPSLQLHASATSQLLLGAAAAALGICGSTAIPLVGKCLTIALALLFTHPYNPDAADEQAEVCELIRESSIICEAGMHKLYQHHQQQHWLLQQKGSALQLPTDAATASRQTMGLLLQILQQLRLLLDKEQASIDVSRLHTSSTSTTAQGAAASGPGNSASSSGGSGRHSICSHSHSGDIAASSSSKRETCQ